MKKNILKIFIIMLIIGCQSSNNGMIERKIELYLDKFYKNDTIDFDLSVITKFRWEKMYIFNESADIETIESIISQPYPYVSDIARRIIFIDSSNKIVYHEDIFPKNPSKFINGQIIFKISDNYTYRIYNKNLFHAFKIQTEKGYYYLIDQ